jgi:hypothetical protein
VIFLYKLSPLIKYEKQILIKVLTAMTIMPPYGNILLYGIESFICSLCLNNEIIIQIVYFLIKEMVVLDGKLSSRYFSLNTLKV